MEDAFLVVMPPFIKARVRKMESEKQEDDQFDESHFWNWQDTCSEKVKAINIMKNETIANKLRSKTPTLTFGDFVAGAYHTYGKRRAKGIIQLAVAAHLIEFRSPGRS